MHSVLAEQLRDANIPPSAFPLMVGACRMGDGASVFAVSYLPLAFFFFIFSILRGCIRVFSRLANIFVLLAQGLERGSYEPDVTGSIPVWVMVPPFFGFFLGLFLFFRGFSRKVLF